MSKNVLIVEDQFIEANNLRIILKTAGYSVCPIANSFDAALDILDTENPELVLLDIFLKGDKTGIDLGLILKKRKIAFIYLSANSDKRTFEMAKETLPYGFLVKPFRKKDVLAMIDIATELHREHLSLSRISDIPKIPIESKKMDFENFGMLGKSSGIKETRRLIQIAATAQSPVLVLGESGTGKELVARAIHDHSLRNKEQIIIVDCAALSPSLIESELFGHEKGSFTGALEKRIGKFEQANNSTIFLDEIGEMPLEIQSKLLRVLQEKEICPIGGKLKKINVRIIAATNRNLEDEVSTGKFRLDLYYRLYVFPIILNPLRERKADILPIAEYYLSVFAKMNNKAIERFSEIASQSLLDYSWPGNVRQLIHLIERSVLLSEGSVINKIDFPISKQSISEKPNGKIIKSMIDNERDHILDALTKCNWKIYGPNGAADLLAINSSTLKSRMIKLGISKHFK